MHKLNLSRTVKDKRLSIAVSFLMRQLIVSSQAVIIGAPFIVLIILGVELLSAEYDKQILLYCFLTTSFIVSYLLAYRQYQATEIAIHSQSQFQEQAIKILQDFGFVICANNKKFLSATRIRNRAVISDDFYAVYTKSSVLVFCLCELPFPFSVVKSKAVVKAIKSRC